MNDNYKIWNDYKSCIQKIERVKLLIQIEKLINSNITLTSELNLILDNLREKKYELYKKLFDLKVFGQGKYAKLENLKCILPAKPPLAGIAILKESEVRIAQRLGLSLEQYALSKIEQEENLV